MLLVLLGSDRPNQPNFINYATKKKGVTIKEKQNRTEKKNGCNHGNIYMWEEIRPKYFHKSFSVFEVSYDKLKKNLHSRSKFCAY